MKIIQQFNPQQIKDKTHHNNTKPLFFTGKPDEVVINSKVNTIVKDLLEKTDVNDWKAPLFNINKNVMAEKSLKHPDHGKIVVKILLRNLADERGGGCYSPNFNEAVITIPKKGLELSSTDLNSDLFKLAIKITNIDQKQLIKPLDPNNPPKGGSGVSSR